MTQDPLLRLRQQLGSKAALVDATTTARALYSTDASIYRIVPAAVATPDTVADLELLLDAARESDLPVTARGAGTSVAGNAIGPGLVLDLRKLNRILAIDPVSQTAVVEPGVIQETLQRAAAPHKLRFGPDPSTSSRCTIAGMVGNNACGPRALGYGTTATNLVDATIVTGTGERIRLSGLADTPVGQRLQQLSQAHAGLIDAEFGRFGRQVSGYSLEHLLTGNYPAFFTGSEGTLGVATELTVRLVPAPPHLATVAVGFATMAEAADAMPVVLPYGPTAVEGLDRRIVEVVRRRRGDAAVPSLPAGDGWIFVEIAGEDPDEVAERAAALAADFDGAFVADPAQATRLWQIRSDGAGLAGIGLEKPAYGGWEDAAVPPLRLGAYLRDFENLLTEHQLHGLPYGHFGDGCVHCRIDFPLDAPDGPQRYRDFVTAAAALVASYGGSLSGEHGDGRARSELLSAMYSPEALALFAQVKALFDPDNLLNPGVLVDPAPVAEHIREAVRQGSALSVAAPDFALAVHRCTGVGRCVADTADHVMCPSYQALRTEVTSTRGRARMLQEMVNGELVTGGWAAPEVHEALDLCLACKGCLSDCPTGTDMASYKSHVLDQAYQGRLRPRSHYALGRLPQWTRLVTALPGLAPVTNLMLSIPPIRWLARWSAGVDQRRPLPRFATGKQRAWQRQQPVAAGTEVFVWVDSFSHGLEGGAGEALLRVLQRAGYAPTIGARNACCGLTWIATGQLDGARAQLRQALDVLHPVVAAGVPVVAMEPSCLAVWRSDAAELLDDPRVAEVAAGMYTLAELLAKTPEWTPPDLTGRTVVAQPHCHHASVLGWQADAALLTSTGADVVTLGGCCGLAGNFGVTQGHYDASVAVAENELLPALREYGDAVLLADGFSCRKQVADLTDSRALTLAQVLDEAAQ